MTVPDYKDSNGKWAKVGKINIKVRTVSSDVWYNMGCRCLAGGAYQRNNPTYIGCERSEGFKDFQIFTNWYTSQIGYGLRKYELDKDLLGCGKLYSEDNCILMPHHLNAVFKFELGETSAGVYIDKRWGTYYSNITSFGKCRRLGKFETEVAAKLAFDRAKAQELEIWYEKITSGDIVVDLRVLPKIEFLINKLSGVY